MSKKPTQAETLQEIKELLVPISNLSRFYIQKINEQIEADKKAKEDPLKQTKTAEGEMKRKYGDGGSK